MANKKSNGMKMSKGKMIALGATGVALTAGAVAAGMALKSRKNRKLLKDTAKKGIGLLETRKLRGRRKSDKGQMYQQAMHEVDRPKKMTTKKSTKGLKRTRK